MPAGVAMFDRQMRYLLASRRWREDWGLENRALTGLRHCEVFPNLPESWRERYENCLGGEEQQWWGHTVRPDGSAVRVRWRATPWREGTGEIGGAVVLAELIAAPAQAGEAPPFAPAGGPAGTLATQRNRTLEEKIDKLLEAGAATRADMAAALQELQQEIAALLQAQKEVERFFNISFEMLCIAGLDGYFRHVNPAFEKTLGYTTEELMAKPFLDSVHPEDIGRTLDEMEKLSTGAATLSFENRYRCKDGSHKWLAWTSIPVLEEGLLYAVARDITPAKQTEQALRESEARFQKLAANVPGMIYQYRLSADGVGALTYVSPGCRDLYENEPEVLLEDERNELIHPEDRPALFESTAESARTLQPWNLEWRIVTPSGKIKWVRGASRPEKQANGDILWDGLVMDITSRVRAEEALRKSEANLAAAQKLAHCGSWEFDAVTQKISWSEEIFRIYGLDPDRPEPTYSEQLELVYPDDRQFWEQTVGQGLYEGKPYEFEYRIVRPDGSVRYVWGQGQPVLNSEGQVIQLFGTVLDITGRKQAEEALRKYQEHLEDLVAERTEELARANQQLQEEMAERQQASEALRHSEARLQRLAANVPGIIYQFLLRADGSRCFPYVSSGCRDLYEVEPEEVGQNPELLFEIIYPDDRQSLEKTIALSAQTLQPVSWEGRCLTPSGRIKWVQTIARAEKQASGDILCDGVTIDITHRIEADAARRESEQRLWTVINNAPLILYGIDSTGIFTFSEGKGLEGMGLQPGEVVGQSVFDLYQFLPNVLEAIRQVLRKGADVNFSADLGGPVYDNRVTPMWGESGEVVGLIGVATEITERVRAESALRESEARERERADQLQGALQEIQRTQAQLVHSEKMSSLGQLVAGVAHEINNPVSFIYGNIDPAVTYIQDLLQLLELYQEYYPVPAPAIQELAEEIDLDFLVGDLPKLLASMKMGAERIRDIVLSLRNFSRLDEAAMKPVDIHAGIDSTLRLLQNRLKETGGRPAIEVIKEYGNLPEVECYAGQMNQVFMNILTNAIDALEMEHRASGTGHGKEKQSPYIRIRTSIEEGPGGAGQNNPSKIQNTKSKIPSDQFVRIEIADSGPGMAEDVRVRLFDPFFTTKPVGKGTGLGMSISYQIVVEKHCGSLACFAAPGQGAEFVIAIPVRQQHVSRPDITDANYIAVGT